MARLDHLVAPKEDRVPQWVRWMFMAAGTLSTAARLELDRFHRTSLRPTSWKSLRWLFFFFAVGQDRPGTRARDAFQNCRPVALVLHVYSLSLSLSFTKRPTLMEHGTRRTDKDVASVFHTHTHTHTHTHHISFFLLAHFLQSGSIWWLQNVPVPHNVPPKPRWGRGQHRGTSTRLKKLKQKPPQEDRRRPSIKTKINESEPKNVPPSSTEPPGGGRGHGRRGRGQLKTTTKPTAAFKKKTNKVMNINRKKT